MRVIMFRLQRANAAKAGNGLFRPAERKKRECAIVMRRNVTRLARDHVVEQSDGVLLSVVRSRDNAEIERDDHVARRRRQSGSIGRFGLGEPAGLIMRGGRRDEARSIALGPTGDGFLQAWFCAHRAVPRASTLSKAGLVPIFARHVVLHGIEASGCYK